MTVAAGASAHAQSGIAGNGGTGIGGNPLITGGGGGSSPAGPSGSVQTNAGGGAFGTAGLGTSTTVLHGNAAGTPSYTSVNLAADVSGSLPVGNLNNGNAASSMTFWRGDGTWSVPPTGGSPGGSSGQIQYNNTGTFGGLPTTGMGYVVLMTSPSITTPSLTGAVSMPSLDTSGTISGSLCRTSAGDVLYETGVNCYGSGGGGNVSNSGTPTSGQIAQWVTSTTVQGIATTGSGNVVLATSPTITTANLGTPTVLVGTNISGTANGLTAGATNALVTASGIVTVSAATAPSVGQVLTATSGTAANWQTLSAAATSITPGSTTIIGSTAPCYIENSTGTTMACTAVTGSGNVVLATSPTLVTPALGTPSSATLTNATGLPVATGISGLGTGVASALGTAVNGSGAISLTTSPAFVTPNLGTPSAATLTNATGLPVGTGISGLGTGVATALGAASTGSGGLALATSASLTTPTIAGGTLTGTFSGTHTYSGATTFSSSITASGLSTGTAASSVCLTSGGLFITASATNCFSGGGSGTVTSVSVTSANGFAGTVATATTTPAISLTTSISGILKGAGSALTAATAGTDYMAPTSTFPVRLGLVQWNSSTPVTNDTYWIDTNVVPTAEQIKTVTYATSGTGTPSFTIQLYANGTALSGTCGSGISVTSATPATTTCTTTSVSAGQTIDVVVTAVAGAPSAAFVQVNGTQSLD